MGEAELLVGGRSDSYARLGEVARFIRRDGEAERRRIDDDEAVAAIGDVDRKRAQAFDLERLADTWPVTKRRCGALTASYRSRLTRKWR